MMQPRGSKQWPKERWRFLAVDPCRAHRTDYLVPRTICDYYESEGTALFRLDDFARKHYHAQVLSRRVPRSRQNPAPYMIHDCRFRWPDGAYGYASVMRMRDEEEV